MPEYITKVEKCLKCGAPVDVQVERQYSAQGYLIAELIHKFRCRGGCLGRGVLDTSVQRPVER
jgi:hypothetical protein